MFDITICCINKPSAVVVENVAFLLYIIFKLTHGGENKQQMYYDVNYDDPSILQSPRLSLMQSFSCSMWVFATTVVIPPSFQLE